MKRILFRAYLAAQAFVRAWGWMHYRPLSKISRWLYNNLKEGELVRVKTAEHQWFLDSRDPYFTRGLVIWGIHEPFETRCFVELLKDGMHVVDVGAHVGWYTLLAASRVGPTGSVVAFEPEPTNYRLLVQNVISNGLRNVTTVHRAVSDRSGRANLFLLMGNYGGHSLIPSQEQRPAVAVTATTLDEFFEEAPEPIDVIKLDIEGAELLAWYGMRRLIERSPSLRIMIEFTPDALLQSGGSAEAFFEEFRRFGFSPYRVDENRRQLIQTDLKDLLDVCDRGRGYTHVFLLR